MKITVLSENTPFCSGFDSEHGLSLFIEANGKKILFDTGQSGLFAENAEKLGVDLTAADAAVISHGHYDHGGGIKRFLELNRAAKVYLNRHAFEPHYSGTERYIGLDKSLKGRERLTLTGNYTVLYSGIELFTFNNEKRPFLTQSYDMNVQMNGLFLPDDFCHEQYMLVNDSGKRVLFSGCSHKGILNIMSWSHPDVLVGGFHFKNIGTDVPEGVKELNESARLLCGYNTVYYTCHCTGAEQYEILKKTMGERLHHLSCGQSIEI